MSDEPEANFHEAWQQQRSRHAEREASVAHERDLLLGRAKAIIHCIDIGAVTTAAEAKTMLERMLNDVKP